MFKTLFLFFMLVFPLTTCNAAKYNVHEALEIAQIASIDPDPVFCSATAIGAHSILTATHCEVASDIVMVSKFGKSRIAGRIRDGNDHTIYLLSDLTFTEFANINLKAEISYGEDVFIMGNPGPLSHQLRKGYVTGLDSTQERTSILFDLNIFEGDSGVGVFNTDNELIAVLSMKYVVPGVKEGDSPFVLAEALPLKFTQDQIDAAKAFVPKP